MKMFSCFLVYFKDLCLQTNDDERRRVGAILHGFAVNPGHPTWVCSEPWTIAPPVPCLKCN